MININLVPQHLRKRRKLSILPVAFLNLPREAVVGLIGGLFVILFVVHIILQFVIFVKLFQYGKYQRQWNRVRPDKMKVDLVVKKMQSLQSKIDSIKNMTFIKATNNPRNQGFLWPFFFFGSIINVNFVQNLRHLITGSINRHEYFKKNYPSYFHFNDEFHCLC